MENVVLVIHLFLALAIIGLVLIQRSEGGGLGVGGGGGGMGRLATPKGTANLLTRATGICGACFFLTSLLLSILAGAHTRASHDILNALESTPVTQQESIVVPDTSAPAKKTTGTPAAPLDN